MAYVLVAIGAVMAAAGLYTVAYSILNTRFEEYWAALGVGVTLTAGGTITIALGFAVRAITRLTTALELRPAATPTAEPAPAAIDPPAAAVEVATPAPAPAAPESAPILVEAEPAIEAAHPVAPVPSTRAPHPLRPTPPPVPTYPLPFTSPPAEAAAPHFVEAPAPDAPAPPATPVAADALGHDLGHGQAAPEFDLHAVPAPRPADDYKLETPSTPEHDLPERPPARPDAGTYSEPPAAPDMPDDWLDRAFAELDEELPVQKPADRAPSPSPSPPPDPAASPAPEPAIAEPAHALAATHEAPPLAPIAPAPAPANPQVIGRYEADGTSYVMYADGSIEAQSSSGVYRFASMAELKSFIET